MKTQGRQSVREGGGGVRCGGRVTVVSDNKLDNLLSPQWLILGAASCNTGYGAISNLYVNRSRSHYLPVGAGGGRGWGGVSRHLSLLWPASEIASCCTSQQKLSGWREGSGFRSINDAQRPDAYRITNRNLWNVQHFAIMESVSLMC